MLHVNRHFNRLRDTQHNDVHHFDIQHNVTMSNNNELDTNHDDTLC